MKMMKIKYLWFSFKISFFFQLKSKTKLLFFVKIAKICISLFSSYIGTLYFHKLKLKLITRKTISVMFIPEWHQVFNKRSPFIGRKDFIKIKE